MRRVLTALVFGLTGPALALGGCTFLITFDDVPRDGSVDRFVSSSSTTSSSSSGFGSSTSSGSTGFIPFDAQTGTSSGTSGTSSGSGTGCDTSLDLTQVQGCENFSVINAQVCASNSQITYPFTSTITRDLITCQDPKAVCITHCTTRCAALPSGSPDECDRCDGKANGTYCGREIRGWSTKNDDLLVACSNNALSTTVVPTACKNGCVASGNGTSHCN